MQEHILVVKLRTESDDWKEYLNLALGQLCKDIEGCVTVYELSDESKEAVLELVKMK